MNSFNRARGIILITVMLFLFILSLLTLESLSLTHQETQMSNNFGRHNQTLMTAELGLRRVEQLLNMRDSALQIDDQHFSLTPWLTNQYSSLNYLNQIIYYNVTTLTTKVCVMTPGAEQTISLQQGAIYRITVWTLEQGSPSIILQATYAKAAQDRCRADYHVAPGRLTWYEIV